MNKISILAALIQFPLIIISGYYLIKKIKERQKDLSVDKTQTENLHLKGELNQKNETIFDKPQDAPITFKTEKIDKIPIENKQNETETEKSIEKSNDQIIEKNILKSTEKEEKGKIINKSIENKPKIEENKEKIDENEQKDTKILKQTENKSKIEEIEEKHKKQLDLILLTLEERESSMNPFYEMIKKTRENINENELINSENEKIFKILKLVEDIEKSMERGEPFGEQLKLLTDLNFKEGDELMTEFQSYYSNRFRIGVSSLESLKIAFTRDVEKAIRQGIFLGEKKGAFNHLMSFLFASASMNDAVYDSGEGDMNRLSRAGFYIKNGKLKDALLELDQLDGFAKFASCGWAKEAEKYLELQQMLIVIKKYWRYKIE